MATPRPLHWLTAGLFLVLCLATPLVQADDSRESWLMQTLQNDNPVREQLAMLSQPDHPLAIRVYRGTRLPCGRRAHMLDGELALSEGLLDELHALENAPTAHNAMSGRWSLLYVLAYLGAGSHSPTGSPMDRQRQARAMLTAANQVMASAWEQAGRPHRNGQRARLLDEVLLQVPYAAALAATAQRLSSDADGFVLDNRNIQTLAGQLRQTGAVTGLE